MLLFLSRKRIFSILLFSLPVMSTGCYRLGKVYPSSMRGIRTLAIPVFQNNTLLPRTEALLADITTRVFQVDGTYEIINESKADAVLRCKLTDVSRVAVLVSPTDWMTTRRLQLRILVAYHVLDRTTGKILQQGTVAGATSYLVGTDLISQERQALPIAARLMANALLSQLTEGW
ncbi:hypothetical protein AMD24_00158 [Candidatus Xiphinematobacter sp. Idaho Grape]|uniref:LPS assembly lipoprotein LptE n=1 Tax=Candidatus Xiphinematobacter sp. Idaho Grape TaxID=1704307 RepID=UPI00070671D9|nr:LPS assembly lipoprotein LptE [Candidatus Xiphinematobacter sp. Idaho Grape]ALJ56353.1 hypothetical protein AMD24_00158 [Candidatus Xiphinematobacter sp. Idaho Grape]